VSESASTALQAVAETTGGSSAQRNGSSHDPFKLLPGTASAAAGPAPHPSSSKTPPTPATKKSGSPSTPKGESSPTTPSAPPKTTTVYHVSVLFGVVPAGPPPPLGLVLTPHDNLKLLTPLPSDKQALIVFRGVTVGGKSATFTVVGEAILHGQATCLPSATNCQEIDLKPGQVEQLEYLPPQGQPVIYELRVVKITSAKASSAAVMGLRRGVSAAGAAALRRAGLVNVPGLRYSSVVGVLVFGGHSQAAVPHA
jgi:hypothetical protein